MVLPHRLPVEYAGGGAVHLDEGRVGRPRQLARTRVAAAHVDGIAGLVAAVVFIEAHMMGRTFYLAPPFGCDVFEGAVYQHGFGIGISVGLLVERRAGEDGARVRTDEVAVDEDVAVVGLGVAYPHEGAGALQRTLLEEGGAAAQHHVAAAVDNAAFEIDRAVDLQGVARPHNPHVAQVIACPHEQEPFGLTLQVGLYGHVLKPHVVAVVGGKGGAARGEGARPFVGLHIEGVGVEGLVVGIVYEHAVAAFAPQVHVLFVAEIDQLLIVAVGDEYFPFLGTEIGYEIHGSLHGAEVTAAVGAHREEPSAGFGGMATGREPPRLRIVDAGKFARGEVEHLFVDGDVVAFAVFEQVVVRVDGGPIAVDDDGVEAESVGEAADDGQLVRPCRVANGRARWGSGAGIGIGDAFPVRVIIIRNRGVGGFLFAYHVGLGRAGGN